MMPEAWYPFFDAAEQTMLGVAVRESIYAFPLIEATHLVALCVLGGAILVVDLRMLGVAMKDQSIATISVSVRPWLIGALAVMLGTGVLLFLSEAIKCFYNTSFWVKIITLPFAIAFTFGVRERMVGGLDTGLKSRLIGLTSIVLWFVVAAAGRWIGYS
jgi:hypothetical protein